MILQIFSVYDVKAEAFLQPFFVPSKGLAVRAFTDAANDDKHQFSQHREDFTLHHLGEFDDVKCSFSMLKVPVPIISAREASLKDRSVSGNGVEPPAQGMGPRGPSLTPQQVVSPK